MNLPSIFYGGVVMLGLAVSAGAQTTTTPQLPPTAQTTNGGSNHDPVEVILKFEELLNARSQQHQAYLESWYERMLQALAALTTIFTAVVLFLNYKSKRDIEAAVSQRIRAKVDEEIQMATATARERIRNFTSQLEKHRQELQENINQLETEFKGNTYKIITAFIRAYIVLNQSASKEEEKVLIEGECRDVIGSLKEIQKGALTNRSIAILLGRLHRKLHNLNAAIQELDFAIRKRIDAGDQGGVDLSDLYFNKACYYNLIAKTSVELALKEQMRGQAWGALKESIRMWPQNWEAAKNDDDLSDLTSQNRTWESLRPRTS